MIRSSVDYADAAAAAALPTTTDGSAKSPYCSHLVALTLAPKFSKAAYGGEPEVATDDDGSDLRR